MPLAKRNGPHGLAIVEQASDFRSIDAELGKIDSRLFLSWEIEDDRKVYRVLYDRGDDAPAEICRWPHALSSGLIDAVKALRPREGPDLLRAQRANEELAERAAAEFEYELGEAAGDVGPRISETRSALLHRGIHLRRSRDRRRSRGENV